MRQIGQAAWNGATGASRAASYRFGKAAQAGSRRWSSEAWAVLPMERQSHAAAALGVHGPLGSLRTSAHALAVGVEEQLATHRHLVLLALALQHQAVGAVEEGHGQLGRLALSSSRTRWPLAL
jgi:hypothetical protein